MAHDVFISYSSLDKTIADATCATLEGERIRCWIASRDIVPGCDWTESIMAAIAASKVMVLVFSEHSNESAQVRREVRAAFDGGLTVIPFRVQQVRLAPALEYYLGPVHWLDALTPPLEAHLKRLAATIARVIGPPADSGTSTAAPAFPAGSGADQTGQPNATRAASEPTADHRGALAPEAPAVVHDAAPTAADPTHLSAIDAQSQTPQRAAGEASHPTHATVAVPNGSPPPPTATPSGPPIEVNAATPSPAPTATVVAGAWRTETVGGGFKYLAIAMFLGMLAWGVGAPAPGNSTPGQPSPPSGVRPTNLITAIIYLVIDVLPHFVAKDLLWFALWIGALSCGWRALTEFWYALK